MLKEFLETIASQVRRGDAATVTEVSSRPRHLLISQGGLREWVAKDPPLRAVKVGALSSLIAYLAPFKDKAQVFLGPLGAVALLDGDDRRESATLALTPTDAWATLSGWTKWEQFHPETIVKELRGLDVPTGVVAALRKLDFKRQSGTKIETEHGKESLGRRVEAEVQGADKVPEFFDVDVSVFAEDGCRRVVTVRVEVYLNVKEETVDLRVTEDRVQRAVAEVLEDIADSIEAHKEMAGVRVFMGAPS